MMSVDPERLPPEARAYFEKGQARAARHKEAARRILAVATELHLSWGEFEDILEDVKRIAYFSSSGEPESTS